LYIEKVTESKLSGASNSQLGVLRLRFIQLWDKHFHQTGRDQLGSLSKADFLDRYKLLLKEMTRRAISPKTVSPIDKFVFDSTIFKFSVASLGDVVVVPDYCSIGGSFVRNPSKASDVDIVIRTPEGQRDETLELKLGRALAKVLHKDIEFIYHPSGPHSSYIPLFDLVLRAKDKMEIVRVKEGKSVDVSKGLSPTQRKECDEETERIKENREKVEWPHKFKPAKYTHPNGHPRCLICGDEEEIGGICHKPEDLAKGKIEQELNLEDFEYLIHHIEVKNDEESVHHCLLVDHIANTFEQSHLWIDKGKVYLDGKEIKEGYFHVIKGLEPTQEITWSNEEAMEAGIKPKEIKTGLTKKEKAKLW